MAEPDRDPVGPDDSEILPASPAANQVFIIISSDPLRAFIAALNPALRAKEEFTIIVDRRRADLENAARPAIERRHHASVDAKVKTDGFAIVPLSTTDAPPWIERLVDRQSADDSAEADEREFRRILEFNRHRRKARLGPLVRTFAIVSAFSVLVVLFVQMPAGKALVNRARLVALPTSERAPEPPVEAQTPSVVEAPAPPSPARPPAGRIGRPRDAARTPTEVSSQPPGPQSIAPLQIKRRQTSPESAPPVWPESVREPVNTAPTPRPDVTPPAPQRPLIVSSPELTRPLATAPEPARYTESHPPPPRVRPGSLPASALDATRSSDGSTPRTAHAASTPGETPAHPSSAPRLPSARGLEAGIEALESRVKSDVNTAGVEAKRQFDDLKSKTMKSLDEMQRMWNNAMRAFSDQDANTAQR
jgi:hypothetical protein